MRIGFLGVGNMGQPMAGKLPPRIGVLERGPWFLKSGQTLVLLGDVGGSEVAGHGESPGDRRE